MFSSKPGSLSKLFRREVLAQFIIRLEKIRVNLCHVLIDVAVVAADSAHEDVLVKLKGLDQVQHLWSDGAVLFLKKLTKHTELLWAEVLALCKGYSLCGDRVKSKDPEENS